MDELESLLVKLLGDSTSFDRMMSDANKALTETANNTARLNQKIEELNLDLTVMGYQSVEAGQKLLNATRGGLEKAFGSSGKFEQTQVAFETMLQSASEAKQLLADLTQFAAKTPFEMPEIEQAARGLVQFGERGKELMDTLKILGNAASGTSSSFGEIALIFNQVRGVGKLLTQDFRQLSTRGIISLDDIAKHFKKTREEAQAMLSGGQVSFEDLRAILKGLSEDGGRFANMMEKQSETLLGKWSTLKDNVNIVWREIGDAIAPIAKMAVQALIQITDTLRGMPQWLKATAGGFLVVGAAVGGALVSLGSTMTILAGLSTLYPVVSAKVIAYAGALTSAATAQTLLNVATGVGWVAAAGAAAVAGYAFGNWLAGGTKYANEFADALSKSQKAINDTIALQDKNFQDDMKSIEMTPVSNEEKLGMYKEELDRIQKNLDGQNDTIRQQEALVKEMEPTWLSLWQGGKKLWEVEQENLKLLEQSRDANKKRLAEVKEAMEKIPKKSEASDEDLKHFQKYTEKLKEQIDTFKMTKTEAEEYAMAQKNIDSALQSTIKAQHKQLELLEKEKRGREELNSLRREIEGIGKEGKDLELLALKRKKLSTADQEAAEKLIKLKYALKEQQELMEKGKELTKSMRSPTEVYRDKIDELEKMFQAGAISQEVLMKATKQAKEEFKTATDQTRGWSESLAGLMYGMREFSPTAVGLQKDLIAMGANPDYTFTPNIAPAVPAAPTLDPKADPETTRLAESIDRLKEAIVTSFNIDITEVTTI